MGLFFRLRLLPWPRVVELKVAAVRAVSERIVAAAAATPFVVAAHELKQNLAVELVGIVGVVDAAPVLIGPHHRQLAGIGARVGTTFEILHLSCRKERVYMKTMGSPDAETQAIV